MKSQRRGEIIFPNHNKINGCESAFSISQENDQKNSLIVKYNKNYIKLTKFTPRPLKANQNVPNHLRFIEI